MAAPLMAKRSTRTRRTKSCALNLASSALKVSTIAPSSPAAASKRNLASSGVSRNSGSSGSKNARGCGSKVSAAEGLPSAPARANAAAITALWPRCTPSKLPMATVEPQSGRAFEIGPNRIADRQDTLRARGFAAALGSGRGKREVVDRGVRFAAIEHLAAARGIGVRQRPGAVDERVAALDDNVRIGANHEHRASA